MPAASSPNFELRHKLETLDLADLHIRIAQIGTDEKFPRRRRLQVLSLYKLQGYLSLIGWFVFIYIFFALRTLSGRRK